MPSGLGKWMLKIKITPAPEKGEANEAVIELL
jgi:uncharacterized protein YggU (UPF0235/DUF167 family)